jgi:glyoxylase-like metal-dependent hydrolase (beta-lactamase superfamily II)
MMHIDADEKRLNLEQQENEPEHPGWLPLGKVLETIDPFFDKFLFMLGYEMSSNIYLMNGPYCTMIDPGNDYTAFLELFRNGDGVTPGQIKKIVLTHGHSDHSFGIFELFRAYPTMLRDGGFELVLHEASPREFKSATTKFGCKVTEVRGGEVIDMSGSAWEVIHTPGHTIDGICLYHPPTRTVITGDTVQPHQMAEPDKDAGGRLDHYLFGIKELLTRDIENVLPGHGAPKAAIGREIVEETYVSLMMKIIGAENPIPWVQGAMALAQKGLFEEAVFCCDKALAFDPENLQAFQMKALCYNDLGRFNDALEIFDALENTLPQSRLDPYTPMGKGFALMNLGRYGESIMLFDEALKVRSDFRDAAVYKGMALHFSGNHEAAMEIEPFRAEFEARFNKGAQ